VQAAQAAEKRAATKREADEEHARLRREYGVDGKSDELHDRPTKRRAIIEGAETAANVAIQSTQAHAIEVQERAVLHIQTFWSTARMQPRQSSRSKHVYCAVMPA
jgi:hypothetical protein